MTRETGTRSKEKKSPSTLLTITILSTPFSLLLLLLPPSVLNPPPHSESCSFQTVTRIVSVLLHAHTHTHRYTQTWDELQREHVERRTLRELEEGGKEHRAAMAPLLFLRPGQIPCLPPCSYRNVCTQPSSHEQSLGTNRWTEQGYRKGGLSKTDPKSNPVNCSSSLPTLKTQTVQHMHALIILHNF